MSFRRSQNAHDQWLTYCQLNETFLARIGLPPELFRRIEIFECFLEDGTFRDTIGAAVILSEIPNSAFLALEEFINSYFDFQDRYPALQQERLRRFQRFA